MSWKTILIILAAVIIGRIVIRAVYFAVTRRPLYDLGTPEEGSGLSAVRLRGPRETLTKMAAAAANVRWIESQFDDQGRLVLPVPFNYTSDDFGRLLKAIDPYTGDLEGLQMLGPTGGIVDDKGVEHPDA